MLMTRDQISQDKSFGQLTDAILQRDQPKTADLFMDMILKDERSLGDALSVFMEAAAPYVQVKCHVNVKDGQVILTNNDHTILGLRTSTDLMPYLPEKYRLLSIMQSVWYVPAGLDIWNQLLFRYPGRYAQMKKVEVPPPPYGPTVWNQDHLPLVEPGTIEERLHEHLIATMNGQIDRAYALFLGLAAEEAARPALRDQLLFLGIIDVQDTIIGRRARNTGHKALRARAIVDLANCTGWDRAHGVFYTGVPDMAVGPLYYSLYDAACVTTDEELPDAGKGLKAVNKTPLTEQEVEDFVRLLMAADHETVWNQVTAFLREGKSVYSLAHTIQVGAAEAMLRMGDPKRLTDGQHAFDYSNVCNYWLRTSDNPHQARVLYLMASFVNDIAQNSRRQGAFHERVSTADQFTHLSPDQMLRDLDEAILKLDVPHSTGLAEAYLRSGADRRAFQEQVALTACKFQNDPHNQKITHSTYEEYGHNSTHLRDKLLLAAVQLLAGWPKMSGGLECWERFQKDYLKN